MSTPRDPARPRRILIMGGTGTIGTHLLRELAGDRARFDIAGAARSAASRAAVEAAGYPAVHMDLERTDTLLPALQGVHTLFMLKPYSMEYLIQSKRVIDAAVKARVSHVVNLGSFGADDTPWSSIGWNRLVEAYLEVSGLGHTTLRPNFFMDNIPPRTDKAGGRIIHYFGETPVSWIAASDIARVAAAVLRDPEAHDGAALPLNHESRTMDEIAGIVSKVTGRSFRAEHIPADVALQQLLARGWQDAFARPFIDYMRAISAGEVPEVGETSDTVVRVTGTPGVGWADWVRNNSTRFD